MTRDHTAPGAAASAGDGRAAVANVTGGATVHTTRCSRSYGIACCWPTTRVGQQQHAHTHTLQATVACKQTHATIRHGPLLQVYTALWHTRNTHNGGYVQPPLGHASVFKAGTKATFRWPVLPKLQRLRLNTRRHLASQHLGCAAKHTGWQASRSLLYTALTALTCCPNIRSQQKQGTRQQAW